MLGTVVIDEIPLPITAIELRNGAFQITAEARGPLPEINSASYVLIGSDARVVYRSVRTEPIHIAAEAGDLFTVEIEADVLGRRSIPEGPITFVNGSHV